MAKKIVKEIIILLLICLAILLVLSVLLYNFIPSNKVIPAEVTYQASEEIKTQLSEAAQSEQTEVVLRYEVTSTDLKNYQKTNSYNAGKVNPFSSYSASTGEEENNENLNNNTNNTTNNNQTSNNSTSNNSTTGNFFETTPGSK